MNVILFKIFIVSCMFTTDAVLAVLNAIVATACWLHGLLTAFIGRIRP